jgi:hypothetical protein
MYGKILGTGKNYSFERPGIGGNIYIGDVLVYAQSRCEHSDYHIRCCEKERSNREVRLIRVSMELGKVARLGVRLSTFRYLIVHKGLYKIQSEPMRIQIIMIADAVR